MERKWEMGGDVTVSPTSLRSTDTEQFGQSDWLGSGILSASDISRTEPLWSPFVCLHRVRGRHTDETSWSTRLQQSCVCTRAATPNSGEL